MLILKDHSGKPVRSLAFSPDGTKLASSARDYKTLLWDLFLKRKNSCRTTKVDECCATFKSLNNTRDNCVFFVSEFTYNRFTFCFTEFLNNNLLCCLCSDTTKVVLII